MNPPHGKASAPRRKGLWLLGWLTAIVVSISSCGAEELTPTRYDDWCRATLRFGPHRLPAPRCLQRRGRRGPWCSWCRKGISPADRDRAQRELAVLCFATTMAPSLRTWLGRLGLISAILASVIGCDQATKDLATETLKSEQPIALLGNFVRLQYVENHGAMLSFGADLPPVWRSLVFTLGVGAFLASVFGFLLFKRGLSVSQTVAWSLVLGGGLGNLIDRVANQGSVVDFVSVGWGSVRTGIFNLADVIIFVGIGLLLWHSRQPTGTEGSA